MPGHFTHEFSSDMRRIDNLMGQAEQAIIETEQVKDLPGPTQVLILDMADYVLERANVMAASSNDRWRKNEWGLYVVGSRARGDAGPDSDLDLLSAGTFFRDQGFTPQAYGFGEASLLGADSEIFDGYDLAFPEAEDLPDSYNVGEVDNKYLVRATPHGEGLPVDISVVDLTFMKTGLEEFKEEQDVDENDRPLPRIPLLEVSVEKVVPYSGITVTVFDLTNA